MNYKKAYKNALERAKLSRLQLLNIGEEATEIEYIFPELRESEDEKISREITEFIVNFHNGNYVKPYDYTIGTWLAWLDKKAGKDKLIQEVLSKHLEKQSEHSLTDKVEPKFKNGQWIVFNGLTLYVKEVVKGFYRTITIDGIPNSYDWDIDNIARLWTIADAKDGDVLVYGDNPADHHLRIIMLFKSMRTFNSVRNHFHIFADEFRINDWCDCGKTAHPATKEQRDLLFAKMKEAGYEFNFEKKELKKIEKQAPKSKWSEEDVEIVSKLQCTLDHVDYDYDTHKKLDNWLKSIEQRMEKNNG